MAGVIDFSWLDLEVPQRRQLDRQPVVLVLAAVNFYPVLKVDQRDFVASFQEAIRREFPVFSPAPVLPPIQVQLPGVVLDPNASIPPSWIFQDVTRDWKVTLSRDTLGFETRSYSGFEDFRGRLTPVLDALVEHVVPTLGTRIGLRFLDEIRPLEQAADGVSKVDDAGWERIVRSELLGVVATPVFRGRIQQSLHQLLLRDKHGVGINITHGVIPSGSMIEPPSQAAAQRGDQPFYALDIDGFQEFERRKEFAVNTAGILGRLDDFHEAISRIFRWSLHDEYLAAL